MFFIMFGTVTNNECVTEYVFMDVYSLKFITAYDYTNLSVVVDCMNDDIGILSLAPRYTTIFTREEYKILKDKNNLEYLTLNNFKGFAIEYFGSNEMISSFLKIYINYCSFQFFNSDLQTNFQCSYFIKNSSEKNLFFTENTLSLSNGVKYRRDYCIEIFLNVRLYSLIMGDISRTFLKSNYFEFIKDNKTTKENLNATITYLSIYAYNIDISIKLINDLLLSNTTGIIFFGTINSFEKDLLKMLYFDIIFFEIFNFIKFFYKSPDSFTSIKKNMRNQSFFLYAPGYFSRILIIAF